jgi:DNA-directed RNA polymerase alpha subunit
MSDPDIASEISSMKAELAAIDKKMDEIKGLYDSAFWAIPRLSERLKRIERINRLLPGNDCRSIEILDLPVRAFNALRNQNIDTIGELAATADFDLLCMPNFGRKSLGDVKEALRMAGVEQA